MQPPTDPIKLAISSCLLGSRVRYDGDHKKDEPMLSLFGPHVQWTPVCPEMEVGMGTPREPVKLVRQQGSIRMLGTSTLRDHTESISALALRRASDLRAMGVCGFVFKSKSPSCGLHDTPIEGDEHLGGGLFASTLAAIMPELPVEDEHRLQDPVVRDNFIERVFAYRRLDAFFGGPRTHGQVVMFHSQSTLQLMSHVPSAPEELAAIVTEEDAPLDDIARAYRPRFMEILATPALRHNHAGALTTAADRLTALTEDQRLSIAEAIDAFSDGLVPLLVPLTLISHHVRETKDPHLFGQTYLDLDPREMLLRYHA